ncbi:MAG: restriction endonuclease subunit S, partial [Pirellula sp.]
IHSYFADHSGEINERVKDVAAKITSGVTPDGGSAGYLDSGVPLLRSQNVHFDGLRLDDVAYISEETHASMRGSQLKPKDVLLNITGASIGRCTFVPDGFGEGNVNQHVCVIRSGPRVDHRFVAAFLSSPMGQDQIFSTFTGASRQGLSHSDLGLIRLPFPKLSLQREIVAKIEHHDLKQRSLFGCIETQIATLTAYRKSLIHECVTGQRRITDADIKRVKAHG